MTTPRPQIVLGPPGTGKTTKLIGEVEAELARGTAPDRIGYVSFTRKAADEAAQRAMDRFQLTRQQLPYFRTLHSLCFQRLGLRRSDVMEEAKTKEFGDYAGVRITGRFSEDGTTAGFDLGDRIIHMINVARARQVDVRAQYDLDDDGLPWSRVAFVAEGLKRFKLEHGVIDYADMLEVFADGQGSGCGLEVLFVDESQDLSALQWRVVARLAEGCRRLIVAGDDDQAIYRWAGADVDRLITMAGDVSVLGQSWRVPRAVQAVADGLIRRVATRRAKPWKARRGEAGLVDKAQRISDVEFGAGEVLVLARNSHVIHRDVEPVLRRAGLVYERHGHPSIPAKVLQAIVSYERLRNGGVVSVTEARGVYEFLAVGSGVMRGHKQLPAFTDDAETVGVEALRARGGLALKELTPWHTALERLPAVDMSYVIAVRQRGESLTKRPRVRVSTIHGAKGGEADHVVLMTEMARRTMRELDRATDDELRVWYVGATRARQRLSIVESSDHRLACPWL